MLTWIKRRLFRRPEPTNFSVGWDGPESFGAMNECSYSGAMRIAYAKADRGNRVTVCEWDGTQARIVWTNA